MCFKLRVPPHVLLAQCRDAATVIASVEGLIWKIWILEEEDSEIGGVYLFANRESAEAYLNHPIVLAVRNNPAVASSKFRMWKVEGSLSAITQGPLWGVHVQDSEPSAMIAGGQ
jgi:hypothetical protein